MTLNITLPWKISLISNKFRHKILYKTFLIMKTQEIINTGNCFPYKGMGLTRRNIQLTS